MMQLHQDYEQFNTRDTVIVAIDPDNTDRIQEFWEDNKLEFYGIPDPEKKVLELYNQKVDVLKLGRMPAQMIIDKAGKIRYIHYGTSMKDIPDNEELLKIIDEI